LLSFFVHFRRETPQSFLVQQRDGKGRWLRIDRGSSNVSLLGWFTWSYHSEITNLNMPQDNVTDEGWQWWVLVDSNVLKPYLAQWHGFAMKEFRILTF
jgi:hypothetical protein